MPRRKLDKETDRVLTEQKKIKLLTEHEGWGQVRALFISKAAKLLNMGDINTLNPDTNLVFEVSARQLAAAKLLDILNEIQGTAEQFDTNSKLTDELKEQYVIRLPYP